MTRTRYQTEFKTIEKLKQKGYKISYLCEVLGVSRSAYYKWLKREPSPSQLRLESLMEQIQDAYDKYKGIYGYRRLTIYLNYYRGAKVNHKCVYRLMKLKGLKAVIRRKRYRYKPSTPQHVADNVLNRSFDQSYEPRQILLTDVTELKYGETCKAYLSAVLDYGEKKIIAYQLSKRNNNQLVADTVLQIEDEVIPGETLFHSDRGFQYTSYFFKDFVHQHELIQSMSRVGKCLDNGPMEAFWGTLKEEMYRLKIMIALKHLKQISQTISISTIMNG